MIISGKDNKGKSYKFSMEDKLVKKLDLMIKRCDSKSPVRDSLLIIEGAEGEGKTTLSVQVASYVAQQTGRPFSVDNLFFSTEKMVEFAKNTKRQIIIWDEPAMEGLSADWFKDTQKDLIRLLMMARKNQHFFIFNFTKFYKFPEYVVVDRALGLIHVYSRRQIHSGRFMYIKKAKLEPLLRDYRSKKIRSYNKHKSFSGSFPKDFDTLIDAEQYDKNKDEAIGKIGIRRDLTNIWKKRFDDLRGKLGHAKTPIKTRTELAERCGIDIATLSRWINVKSDLEKHSVNRIND